MPSNQTANLLEVNHLVKHFPRQAGLSGSRSGVVKAVEDVSFTIQPGEILGLVGESGSGKSTIGRLILRLIDATSGSVTFDSKSLFNLSATEMKALRRDMQIVFQDPYGAFNPRMTVGRIIAEALELKGTPANQRDAEICRLLETVQLSPNVRNRYPHEFSGGQRQRIGIARALAVEPKFLVADEPVSALDVSTQAEIVNLLLELQKSLDLTMLFISHDMSVVRILADRIAVLYSGRLLELATTDSLFMNPLQPYTQELLAAIPEPDPEKAKRNVEGEAISLADVSTPSDTGCPYYGRCAHKMPICETTMPQLKDYKSYLNIDESHLAACHWVEQNLNASNNSEVSQ